MAKRKYYVGSSGPFLYDDGDQIDDQDGDFAGEDRSAFRTDGKMKASESDSGPDGLMRREDIEALSASDVCTVSLSNGQTTLSIGTQLSSIGIEVVNLFCNTGSADIATITGGTDGHLKIFVIRADNIKFSTNDNIILNQTYSNEFEGVFGDTITMVNMGGDPGTSANGTWREVDRNLSVI